MLPSKAFVHWSRLMNAGNPSSRYAVLTRLLTAEVHFSITCISIIAKGWQE